MSRKYVPAVLAALLGVSTGLTEYASFFLIEFDLAMAPSDITWSVQMARFASFVLVYGLLFGCAYWAAWSFDVPTGYGSFAGTTVFLGALGALLVNGYVVLTAGPGPFEGWLVEALLILAKSLASGVELAVVALAGAGVAHLRRSDRPSHQV